jgi:uncharacterized protein (DUF433 family)
MSMLERTTIDPDICHGAPTVRGQRHTVEMIVGLLASGMTTDEIVNDYSDLGHDDVRASSEYAAKANRIAHSDAAIEALLDGGLEY